MPGAFLDTSAVAKRYHAELGSAEVDRLWTDAAKPLFISRIGAIELISVFAGKVRTGVIGAGDFQLLRKRFLADVALGRPQVIRMRVQQFKDAESLIRRHGLSHQLRTLDALQLAVALDVQQRGLVDLFVCSDRALLTVAAAEGIATFDPENP